MVQLAMVHDSDKQNGNDAEDLATWESFWLLYPRHEAKKDARKVWDRMSDADRMKAVIAICAWRRVWNAQQRDTKTTPLPATWLNGERWDDEVPPEFSRTVAACAPAKQEEPFARTVMPDFVKQQIAKLRSTVRGH